MYVRAFDGLAQAAERQEVIFRPRPGGPDDDRFTDVVFHAHHPERRLAPLKKHEVFLVAQWNEIRDYVVRPALRRAPLCTPAVRDWEVLADNLRWLNDELKRPTKRSARLRRLRRILNLQVKVIIQSLDSYIKTGCTEGNLRTLEVLILALPWLIDLDTIEQRDKLINAVRLAEKRAKKD